MNTYYTLLDLKPKATKVQIQAMFRRFIGGYRPTLPIDQLFADTRFRGFLNAYITLSTAELREKYDALLKSAVPAGTQVLPLPQPFDDYSPEKQQILLARIAFWRREMVEAIHQIRLALESDSDSADAWGLLGEIYLSVGRIEDGIHAYQRAESSSPGNPQYAERLRHARQVLEGKAVLEVDISPSEELRREERRHRWLFTVLIMLLGAASITYSLVTPFDQSMLGFLNIPWGAVTMQAAGVMLLLLGLGFGRVIQPFEQVLVWSTLAAGDRGRMKTLPYGLLIFVMSAASLWLGILGFFIMAIMDDEWPTSTSIMMGICMLVNVGCVAALYLGQLAWGGEALFGGNILVIAAMFGWYIGSLGTPQYD